MKVWLKAPKRLIPGSRIIDVCPWLCVALGLSVFINMVLPVANIVIYPGVARAAETAAENAAESAGTINTNDTPAPGKIESLAISSLAGNTGKKSILPEWPEEFGPPHDITRASRWPGYKAVMGPDSNIWCVTLDGLVAGQGDFVLTRITHEMNVLDSHKITSLEGDIVNFDVAAGDDEVILAWAEKRGDDFYILIKEIRCLSEGVEELGKGSNIADCVSLLDTRQFLIIKSVAADIAVSISDGRCFIGWVDQEEGRPGVFVSELPVGMLDQLPVDGLAQPAQGPENGQAAASVPVNGVSHVREFSDRIRLSNPAVSVGSLKLAPAPGGVWVVWVQTGQIVNQVMVRAYVDGSTGTELKIMDTTATEARGISLLVSDDGTCHLVFTQGRISRGGVGRPVVVYGTLKSDGYWIAEPISITHGEGHVVAPSAAFGGEGLEVAWSDNRDGKFQVHHASVQISSNVPRLVSAGAATLSSKECMYPQIFVFQNGAIGILYQVYLSEGDMLLQGVSATDPREPGWAYYLGLDLERPVQDGFFRLVNGLAAALVVTLLAIPSLAAAVAMTAFADRLKVFSETWTGTLLRFLCLFGAIFLLKQPGVWFYLFAPVLPGWIGWLSFALASAATISLCLQSRPNFRDILFTALAGALFVFFDSMFSIIVKGVGLF
jgi:hypothetical protein